MSCTNTPTASREAAVSGPFGNRWAKINKYQKMLRNNYVISDLFEKKIIIKWRTYIEVCFGNNSIHITVDILRRFQSMINHHRGSQRNNAACDYWKDQNRDLFWINIFQTRIKITPVLTWRRMWAKKLFWFKTFETYRNWFLTSTSFSDAYILAFSYFVFGFSGSRPSVRSKRDWPNAFQSSMFGLQVNWVFGCSFGCTDQPIRSFRSPRLPLEPLDRVEAFGPAETSGVAKVLFDLVLFLNFSLRPAFKQVLKARSLIGWPS